MQLERNVGGHVHVISSSTDHLKEDSTITEQLMAAFQCEWHSDTTELLLELPLFGFPQCSRPCGSSVLDLVSITHFVKGQHPFPFWPQPVLRHRKQVATHPGKRKILVLQTKIQRDSAKESQCLHSEQITALIKIFLNSVEDLVMFPARNVVPTTSLQDCGFVDCSNFY